jgi:hypothetical protein
MEYVAIYLDIFRPRDRGFQELVGEFYSSSSGVSRVQDHGLLVFCKIVL